MEIRTPKSEDEWNQYFQLRYDVLRKPWNQPLGSERDTHENEAFHLAVVIDGKIIGVGRLDYLDSTTRQIRYMAVDPNHQGKHIGALLMAALEQEAWDSGANVIILHARAIALGFYENQGYNLVEPSHLLFNEIQHFLMQKKKG